MNILSEMAFRVKRFAYIPIVKARLHGKPYFFHYTPDISGGVASWLQVFAQAFPDYEHLVVCTRGTNTSAALLLSREANVHLARHANYRDTLLWIRLLHRPVVFFNHVFWDLQIITKTALKCEGFPVVAILHGHDSKLVCSPREIDRVVVFSRYYNEIYVWRDRLAEYPISVLPLAINTARFSVVQPSHRNNTNGTFVFGNITNGAAWKHSDDFVSLCLDIREKIPAASFMFLGAKDLQIKNGDSNGFHVFYPYSIDVPNYLAHINVLLHKTRADYKETWCLAVTEAMAAGIPVIAEAKGGVQDQVVHGETGFLCQNNKDFVRYSQLLYEDKDLYWRVSANARRHAEKNFSLKVYRNRIEKQWLCSQESPLCK